MITIISINTELIRLSDIRTVVGIYPASRQKPSTTFSLLHFAIYDHKGKATPSTVIKITKYNYIPHTFSSSSYYYFINYFFIGLSHSRYN